MAAFTVTDLSTLDPAAVADVQAELAQRLAEQFPQVDLTRGVVHDVVLHLGAILAQLVLAEIDRVRQSMSLVAIQANPALADPALVDAVLSNFGVTRLAGTAARGAVTVLLDAKVPVVIPAGTAFTIGGAAFVTAGAYAVRTDAAQATGDTDLVLTAAGPAAWAFSVPVTAAAAGLAGMVRRGAAAVPAFAIPHFAAAYAAGDFTGGADPEDNAALLARLQNGLAAKTAGSRANIDALVRAQPAFAATTAVSVIGAGDPEMLRDKHTLFPIGMGGRCDCYARTAAVPAEVPLTRTATYLGPAPGGAGGLWQFALAAGDAPGFYEVARVARPGDDPGTVGFAVTSDVRGLDLSAGGTVAEGDAPDLLSPPEAAYSAFQTAVIQFVDDRTGTAGLTPGVSTADYAVAVSALPGIGPLQTFLGGREVRPPAGDILVRAPVPCFLTVSFEVRLPPGGVPPDVPALQAAVAAAISAQGFRGRLDASLVVAAVAGRLPAGAALGPIDLFGRVRQADGTVVFLRDPRGVQITVPDHPAVLTTGRTVAFYCTASQVAIAVVTLAVPLV